MRSMVFLTKTFDASLTIEDAGGRIPLQVAVHGKAAEVTEDLLKDADQKMIDRQARDGATMLLESLFYPPSPAITFMLINHSANLHLTDNDGVAPLHAAACTGTPEQVTALF